jgi:hypothetical protein
MTLDSITNCVTNHHSSMAIDCMDSAVRTLQEHFWTYELLHTLWPSQNSWPINLHLNCAQTNYIVYKTKYQIMKIKLLVCWNNCWYRRISASTYLMLRFHPKIKQRFRKKIVTKTTPSLHLTPTTVLPTPPHFSPCKLHLDWQKPYILLAIVILMLKHIMWEEEECCKFVQED